MISTFVLRLQVLINHSADIVMKTWTKKRTIRQVHTRSLVTLITLGFARDAPGGPLLAETKEFYSCTLTDKWNNSVQIKVESSSSYTLCLSYWNTDLLTYGFQKSVERNSGRK